MPSSIESGRTGAASAVAAVFASISFDPFSSMTTINRQNPPTLLDVRSFDLKRSKRVFYPTNLTDDIVLVRFRSRLTISNTWTLLGLNINPTSAHRDDETYPNSTNLTWS